MSCGLATKYSRKLNLVAKIRLFWLKKCIFVYKNPLNVFLMSKIISNKQQNSLFHQNFLEIPHKSSPSAHNSIVGLLISATTNKLHRKYKTNH